MQPTAEIERRAHDFVQGVYGRKKSPLTVEELRRMLLPRRDDLRVVFVTERACPEGYPEWDECFARYDADTDVLEIVLEAHA